MRLDPVLRGDLHRRRLPSYPTELRRVEVGSEVWCLNVNQLHFVAHIWPGFPRFRSRVLVASLLSWIAALI